jgi:hypothetical protein
MQTGLNRRHFLQHLAGASALAVPGWHFLQGLRAAAAQLKKENKSLIILWMGGGPSHMDTWDVKPGESTGGEFKPIKTNVSGIEISEILPNLAKQMQHLTIVRSLVTNEGSHERGTTLMNTGKPPSPAVQYPAMGSVVSSLLTTKELALPGFIGVGGTAQRVGPGFLGMMHAPFTVQNPGQPPANIKAPAGLGGSPEETMERVRRRQRLFYSIEDEFNKNTFPHFAATSGNPKERDKQESALREAAGSPAQAHEAIYNKAFDLTVSPLRTVFEVRREPKAVLEEYGGVQNQFGMGCLLARRLVEKGVTCVEVDLAGWDMHTGIFTALKRPDGLGARLDKGMAALVKDLVDRSLWKNTVVLWMGEFGRTPRINQNAGRDHWARCWSVVVGGGGLKGGQVYGSTSKDGLEVKDNPCSVGDLFATVYKGLGLDLNTKIRDSNGRPLGIAEGSPLKGIV